MPRKPVESMTRPALLVELGKLGVALQRHRAELQWSTSDRRKAELRDTVETLESRRHDVGWRIEELDQSNGYEPQALAVRLPPRKG